MSPDWIVTIRVRLRNCCEHDEPGAEAIVRNLIQEETLMGVSDWPDDYEILDVKPDRPEPAS